MKFVLMLMTCFLFSLNTNAGDIANGKKLYKKIGCKACHKKDGMGKAKIKNGKLKITGVAGPRIAGLNEEYIVAQLKAIQGKDKASVRKTRNTISMKSKIKKLTDKDFTDLATYISKELSPKDGAYKGMLE